MRRPLALAAVLGLLAGLGLLAAGCGTPAAAPVTRFIVDDPQELLDGGMPYGQEVVFEWDVSDSVWVPGPDPNPPIVNRETSFDAAEVHVVEVVLDHLPVGQLKIFWRREGGDYNDADQLTLQAEHMQTDGVTKVFPFAMVAHPGWLGRITGLRVYTHQNQRPAVVGRTLRALRRTIGAEPLAAALAHAWKVNLGQDLRSALLAPPGIAIEREVVVPEGARLRFAYGLEDAVRQPVSFRVVADRGWRGVETVFETTLDGAAEREKSWHETEVDLAALAGAKVKLRLETATERRLDPALGFPLWANPEVVGRARADRPPNVVLISIDTLRADHLSLHDYPRPTSPRLDAWARERGVVFRQAVAQAPSTLPSHTSMFTGLDAFHHGVNHAPASPQQRTLAEMLREAGYATLARTGGGYLHPRYGLFQGFDTYRYWLYGHDRDRELDDGLETALGWLERHADQPFFLFFHTYEVHSPYRPREPYFSQFSGGAPAPEGGLVWMVYEEPTAAEGFRAVRHSRYRVRSENPSDDPADFVDVEVAKTLYDSSIAHVDAQLGRLLDRLDALGLGERTLVVVTSDHGEAFGEQGLAGHGYLYDSNLLIPLVMALPGGRGAGREVDAQVRSIDVVPTLAELLGLEPPPGIDGVSLVPLIDGASNRGPEEAWAYAANDNHGIALRARGRLKYIFNNTAWPAVQGAEELYRLDGDPGEEHAENDARELAPLRRRVEEVLTAAPGLRMRLANRGPSRFEGTLRGQLLGTTRVKAVQLPCRCIAWQGEGVMTFELPPATELTLAFEGDVGSAVSLEGRLLDGGAEIARLDQQLALEGLETARFVRWADGGWQTGEAPEPGADTTEVDTGVVLWWQGEGAGHESFDYETEPELMRQLQALGYVTK